MALLLPGAAFAGCGDGYGEAKPAADGSTAAASTSQPKPAKDVMPDLSAQGYRLVAQEADPGGALTGTDSWRAIFQKGQTSAGTLVAIYGYKDAETAKKEFATKAAALKVPSSDFLGVATTFVDAPSPQAGDERKSYVSEKPDSGGNRAWTDAYRIGRYVVIVQVLDSAQGGEQLGLRDSIAKAIVAKAR